jgi:hypothetical protein
VSVEPKPKRAISGYHVYVREQLTDQNYEKTTFAEQMKQIGADWKSMPQVEKDKFQNQAAAVNRQREKSKGKASTSTPRRPKQRSRRNSSGTTSKSLCSQRLSA